jgi:hypothetical protein
MLVGKEHNAALEHMAKWEMKRVICWTVFFSLIVNIGHWFQYRLNQGLASQLAKTDYTVFSDQYPILVNFNTSLRVYTIVYFVFSFIVFFVVNTAVEVSLVLKMRAEIAEKRFKTEEEIRVSQSKNTSRSEVVNRVIRGKQKKIEQDAKKETRVIGMVVYNSVINFLLRGPEILVFLSSDPFLLNVFYHTETKQGLHFSSSFTTVIVSVSYFMYILTFTTNVMIYYFFNAKFKQLFIWWVSNAKQK